MIRKIVYLGWSIIGGLVGVTALFVFFSLIVLIFAIFVGYANQEMFGGCSSTVGYTWFVTDRDGKFFRITFNDCEKVGETSYADENDKRELVYAITENDYKDLYDFVSKNSKEFAGQLEGNW